MGESAVSFFNFYFGVCKSGEGGGFNCIMAGLGRASGEVVQNRQTDTEGG